MGRISLEVLKQMEGSVITNSPSRAGNWLAPKLIKVENGAAIMEVIVKSEMCNPYGNIHGGMMCVVMDEAIGWAIISANLDLQYTSVSLNTNFLYAAAEGEAIIASSKIVRTGKKILYVEVHVHNKEGVLLAHGTSHLVSTSMRINMGNI
jgi:acyl-coenzyme A thioesterase 13